MFYCCSVTLFVWNTSLVQLTCKVQLVSRSYAIALGYNSRLSPLNRFFRPQLNCVLRYDDSLLDGVHSAFVIFSSITCFLWHWPLISFRALFSYIVWIIYDGLLTLSKYLFLIVECFCQTKIPVHGVYPVYAPTNPANVSAFGPVKSTQLVIPVWEYAETRSINEV